MPLHSEPVGDAGIPIARYLGGNCRAPERRTPVLFHYARGKNAILGAVDDRWKYAWSAPDQKEFLFERRDQPEKHNLAEAKSAAPALQRLRETVQNRAAEHSFSRKALDRAGAWKTQRPAKMPANPDAGLLYQDPPLAKPELPPEYHLEYPGKFGGT